MATPPTDTQGPEAGPPPFPEALLPEAIAAAVRLWEPLAARAWHEYAVAARGRGVLLLAWDELRNAAAATGPTESDPGTAHAPVADVPATWVTTTIVHRGDDFRGLLQRYDPARQVMLIVGHPDGGEALFALECDGEKRPDPETCWRRRHEVADD